MADQTLNAEVLRNLAQNTRIAPTNAYCPASGTNLLPIRPVFVEFYANDPGLSRDDCSMTEHRYQIGEGVHLERSLTVKGGVYVVTKLLPEHDGEFQYRIKSAAEPHERVVRESQLTSDP
jgi:hypothetical protein